MQMKFKIPHPKACNFFNKKKINKIENKIDQIIQWFINKTQQVQQQIKIYKFSKNNKIMMLTKNKELYQKMK